MDSAQVRWVCRRRRANLLLPATCWYFCWYSMNQHLTKNQKFIEKSSLIWLLPGPPMRSNAYRFIFLRHQKYHTISNGLVENKQVFSTALTESGRARRLACRSRRQRKVSTHDVCFCSMIGHSLATSAVPKCARGL